MRKKGLLILAAALILNVCCFSLVYAYSVSTAAAMNEYTVGDNEIEINEVFEPPARLNDGDEIQKEVTVTNTGRTDCAVRLFIKPNDMEIMNRIAIDINMEDWHDGQDGYYYYKGILAPGQTTEALFSEVSIQSAAVQQFQLFVFGESRAAKRGQNWYEVWNDKVRGRIE